MSKFEAAEARLFHNVYVCKDCKTKVRAPTLKVLQGKVRCRKCGSKNLRPKRKK